MQAVSLYRYRGYRLEICAEDCTISFSVERSRPDLPLVLLKAHDSFTSEYEALSAAKKRIDRVLEDRE